jgi:hypothetical protein
MAAAAQSALKIDDAFAEPIIANLVEADGSYSLIWSCRVAD